MKDNNQQAQLGENSKNGLTRRHFLKSSSIGAAAMAASVSHIYQAQAAEPSNINSDQPTTESKKMNNKAKITLVQLTENNNPDDAVKRMPQYFQQAAEYGSDLIVFPEYIL